MIKDEENHSISKKKSKYFILRNFQCILFLNYSFNHVLFLKNIWHYYAIFSKSTFFKNYVCDKCNVIISKSIMSSFFSWNSSIFLTWHLLKFIATWISNFFEYDIRFLVHLLFKKNFTNDNPNNPPSYTFTHSTRLKCLPIEMLQTQCNSLSICYKTTIFFYHFWQFQNMLGDLYKFPISNVFYKKINDFFNCYMMW
jgi:hypothetical protein